MSTQSNGSKPEQSSLLEVQHRGRRMAQVMYQWESLVQKHFHGTVEVQMVMYFLAIAGSSETPDQSNVAKQLGLTRAAASRNYYKLSSGMRGEDGLGLIEAIDDPLDYRRKLLQLTPKGQLVSMELGDYIYNRVKGMLNHAIQE